jgi:hypothetical protein
MAEECPTTIEGIAIMTHQDQASRAARRPSGLTDLSGNGTRDISAGLNGLLADVFALYSAMIQSIKIFLRAFLAPVMRAQKRSISSWRLASPAKFQRSQFFELTSWSVWSCTRSRIPFG